MFLFYVFIFVYRKTLFVNLSLEKKIDGDLGPPSFRRPRPPLPGHHNTPLLFWQIWPGKENCAKRLAVSLAGRCCYRKLVATALSRFPGSVYVRCAAGVSVRDGLGVTRPLCNAPPSRNRSLPLLVSSFYSVPPQNPY